MNKKDTNKMIVVGIVNPKNNDKQHQRNWVYSPEGICNTQTSTQFKDPTRIIVRCENE